MVNFRITRYKFFATKRISCTGCQVNISVCFTTAVCTQNGRGNLSASFYIDGPFRIDIEFCPQAKTCTDQATDLMIFWSTFFRNKNTLDVCLSVFHYLFWIVECIPSFEIFHYIHRRTDEEIQFKHASRFITTEQVCQIHHTIQINAEVIFFSFYFGSINALKWIVGSHFGVPSIYLATESPDWSNELTHWYINQWCQIFAEFTIRIGSSLYSCTHTDKDIILPTFTVGFLFSLCRNNSCSSSQ